MPRCVGLLGSEGRTEGVDFPQCAREHLRFHLPRHGEVHGLAEEVTRGDAWLCCAAQHVGALGAEESTRALSTIIIK